jgi:pimeloyl-ACP methyl ester carboxylesterase
MVFLHAFPLDSRMWKPLASLLEARGITCHGFDYPGLGTTPLWPTIEPSIDAIADAAVATLRDGIGASAAHWVGCSMGGYVALAIADRHPDAVAGLGLIDTRSGADNESTRQRRLVAAADVERLPSVPDPRGQAEALIGLSGAAREAAVMAATEIIGSAHPHAVAWGQRAMAARPDRTRVVEGLGKPVVVVWGENDAVASLEEAEVMARAAAVPVVAIPGVGHLSPLEHPGGVADALLLLR